jgi:hypothetical protein
LFLQADHFFFDLDRKVYPLRVTQTKEIVHQTKNKKLNNGNEFLFLRKLQYACRREGIGRRRESPIGSIKHNGLLFFANAFHW